METRPSRLKLALFTLGMALLAATPSMATTFTVHSYQLGERIALTDGTRVWTAQLDVTLEGVASHVASFCVDLQTSIAPGTYTVNNVLDAFSSPSPAGEAVRTLAWAGHVIENFTVASLAVGGITAQQAITGLQAAIWEGIYGGGKIDVTSLSANAQLVFNNILSTQVQGDGPALVVDLRGYQDQVIRGGSAVPEPSAALIFGLGSVVAGSLVRRKAA
ncbi:MAG: thioester domain-containing protein [Deltaproteobacteria bacterium]|nr:thioester domain-containing protein [Deltaproteobacteria bacterium]